MRAYRFHQQQQQFAAAPPVVENTGLTPMKRAQLMRVLGMLGSAHPGERDNAARLAERIRRAAGLTWEQLIRGGKDEPRHRPHATEREKW